MGHQPRGGRNVVAVVEAAHTRAESIHTWLDNVIDVARPALASELGLIATITRRAGEVMTLEAYSEVDNPLRWLRSTFEGAVGAVPASDFEPYYGPGQPVRTLEDVRRKVGHADMDVGAQFVELGGLEDLVLLVAHPSRDVVLAIAALHRRRHRPDPPMRRQLTQMTLHLENAARLHLETRHEVAMITPDGRIAHAESAHTSAVTRDRLRAHVRGIERIRAESMRAPSNETLDAWPALVNGTYSLVEQTDRDGRRHYAAFENPVASRAHRVLTVRERSVLELSARGLAGKWVAYSLGISETAVSESLASTALKLGLSSRTRVVAAMAALGRDATFHDVDVPLTETDRTILSLVREGLTNEAIARRRGRSVRTIANQVAVLLRKTGAVSRRALAAMPTA